ncbi:MAG TPA: motility-associated protein, partial [Stellaceae bacterium]|nr:motility-associated protein [Stellaceae bacterium]
MFLLIGSAIVLVSVFGGYALNGGHLAVLFQPFEFLIIAGAALGAFLTANRLPV